TSGSHQTSFSGGTEFDGFIVKFNTNGVRQWGTYYGGSGEEFLASLACDASGRLYAGGATLSTSGMVTTGAHQTSFSGPGSTVGFLACFYTANGTRAWGTYYGDAGPASSTGTTI